MDNFVFQNPTKILFGKGTEDQAGAECALWGKRALVHYGGGSVQKSGLLGRVLESLNKAGVQAIELSGVKPNPRLSLVRAGIEICRKNKIEVILAVGGGSSIDSAKAIAVGVPYSGDVWDFYTGKAQVKKALPVGTILTLPAAGSESSSSSVITNEEGWFKKFVDTELIYPKFSILNPELAFTLPPFQVACGAADILAHLMERYFTNTKRVELTDRLIEATMKTIIRNIPLALAEPTNYDAWAEVMWAGTIAHNNLLNTGRVGDWGSHMIEHELSGIYDVAHGAGLAVVFPAWLKHTLHQDPQRFVQFAVRVWNVDPQFFSPEKTALEGIAELEAFFASIGLATRLKGLNIPLDRVSEMADKCTKGNTVKVGNFVALGKSEVEKILRTAE